MARGQKSKLWHAEKRCRYLIEHLETQLSSGRYIGDQDQAVSWIVSQKMRLVQLQHELAREA